MQQVAVCKVVKFCTLCDKWLWYKSRGLAMAMTVATSAIFAAKQAPEMANQQKEGKRISKGNQRVLTLWSKRQEGYTLMIQAKPYHWPLSDKESNT